MRTRIAFHTPLKPPDHPIPSGDRRFARLLIRALRQAGMDVTPIRAPGCRNRNGDTIRQRWIESRTARAARILEIRHQKTPFDIWLTYHSYYKAPDMLGPLMSELWRVPYVLIEASHAPERASSAWRRGHQLNELAIRSADLILQPNPKDITGVSSLLSSPFSSGTRQISLPPFTDDPAPVESRANWSEKLNINPNLTWILAAGMMREDVKARSFRLLAEAMAYVNQECVVILAGDGPARARIETCFDKRAVFTGLLTANALNSLYQAADLYAWPAIGEAFGMTILEAQIAGLPVVVGDRPGTRAMVQEGLTGLLTPEGDAAAFGKALSYFLENTRARKTAGQKARQHVLKHHSPGKAATFLKREIHYLMTRTWVP